MKKLVVLLLLVAVLCSSNLLAQSFKGIYSGKYIFETSQVSEEYNIIVRFTDSTYQIYNNRSGFCEPSGRYSLGDSTVLFEEFLDGCGSITSDMYPVGEFSYFHDINTLTITGVFGDTLKQMLLADKTSDYEIIVFMDNQAVPSTETTVEVPVYLANTKDTLAGFNFWIQLDRPDLLQYEITFDTTNTLLSGWELVEVRSISGTGFDLNVVGIANLPDEPFTNGIAPQDGTIPLIKFRMNVLDVPDFITDRTVRMIFQRDFRDHFGFATPSGTSIGIVPQIVLDTSWYVCTNWMGEICLDWLEVFGPPADSFFVSSDTVSYTDTTKVYALDGTFSLPKCGNMNGFDNQVDISDLLYMVDYMFLSPGGPAPVSSAVANVDNEGEVDISDLLLLVDYMFLPPGSAVLCP